jgi:hypothetical protein
MSTEYLSTSGLKNTDYVQTGDILLFRSRGNRTSNLINIGIRSSWTHVGIAIWEGGELKLFESSLSESVFDELTGTYKKGTRKTNILNVLDRYAMVLTRPLNISRTPLFYERLDQFIENYTGRDYTSFLKIPFIPLFCMEDSGIHCSELVARYLKFMGLFDDKPGLNSRCLFNFLPSDFAPENMDSEIDRLFIDSPSESGSNSFSITLYTSPSVESPSLLFLCVITLIVASIHILIYLTKK